MNNPVAVTTQGKIRQVSVGARYRADRAALLEVLQHRRGDASTSDTIRAALDAFLVEHGLLSENDAAEGVA